MMSHHPSPTSDVPVSILRKRRGSYLSGWLQSVIVLILLFVVFSFVAFNLEGVAEAAAPPVVNGLFYGDGDNNDYILYGTSEYGSGLYIYFQDPIIYVALVVDRSVNDNVFTPPSNKVYTQSAGWSPPRDASRLTDSEFAQFDLSCESAPNQWNWQQGYAGLVGGVWVSDETVSGGSPGTTGVPPGYTSASSMAWNFNTYEAKAYPGGVPWDMYVFGMLSMGQWKSPWDPGNPNNVIGLDGYPATGPIVFSSVYDYEWPMVYEWSADLSVCGSNPIFVVSGASHHSPSKNSDENDDFPPDPDPQPLTDYGDLPDSYSTLEASNGARHTLTINGAHFGTSPDPEVDGQPSPDASGDMMSVNDEDGVSRSGATNWVPGNTVNLNLNVQGSTLAADVGVWIDWNNDGDFDEANEFYLFLDLPTGGSSIVDVLIPGSYTTGQPVYVRARIFNDEADAPGGSLDAGDYQGLGTTGEVEDYQWFFGPTAITLVNATTGNQDSALQVVLALAAAALLVTTLYIGRRQTQMSGK